MVRITSHFDKDIKKKVLEVRGDEAYAHSTDVVLTNSTIADGRLRGFKTSLTATVYRGLGASTLVLYDGKDVIGQKALASGSSSVTWTDLYFAWDIDHPLKVKYLGNEHCLPSKSKVLNLQEDMPDDLKVVITDSSTHQINGGASHTISATLTVDGSPISSNATVSVYVDGTLKTTLTSTNQTLTGTITGLTDGKHTITLTANDSSSFKGNSISYDIKVGYNISILSYPSTFVTGGTNVVSAQVTDYDNSPVSSATVTVGSYSGTTDSDGIANVTLSSYISGNYTASYGGSTSTAISSAQFTPTSIDVTSDDGIVAMNYYEATSVTIDGSGDKSNIPIVISVNGTDTETIYTDSDGIASTRYYATGLGDVTYTATIDGTSVTDSATIEDVCARFTATNGISYNFGRTSRIAYLTGSFEKYSNYMKMKYTSSSPRTSITGLYSLDETGLENTTDSYVISVVAQSGGRNCDLRIGAGTSNIYSVPYSEFTTGDIITAECSLNSTVIKINGEVYTTKTHSKTVMGLPCIGFNYSTGSTSSKVSSWSMNYGEIKVKRISD